MNEYLFILPIILANILGVMSPGPSFIFIAQRTLTTSRKHGLISALGLGTGAAIFAILSCFGLFVVLEAAPFLYGALKIFGGLYLLFLAYRIWHSSKANNDDKDNTQNSQIDACCEKEISVTSSYLLGLMTQMSNPKTAIVIGSIIMAFLPAETPPYTFIIITVLMFLSDWAWYSIVVLALSTTRAQKFYNRFKQRINQIASGLMGFLGIKLAFNL